MKFTQVLKHIAVILGGIILLLGVPLVCTGYVSALISGGFDVVSGASVVLDEPSGEFVILINKDIHNDQSALDDWVRFFSHDAEEGELIIIFEDIACSVPGADAAGVEMAESLRSQLPENQMKLEKEDATLIMSRADRGWFDMILMSREFAEAYHAETAYTDSVEVIEIKGDKE